MLKVSLIPAAIVIAALVISASILYSVNSTNGVVTEQSTVQIEMQEEQHNETRTTLSRLIHQLAGVEAELETQNAIADRDARQRDLAARVERVKALAAECASFTALNHDPDFSSFYEQEQLAWIALTGANDPDSKMEFRNAEMVQAIEDRCYHSWFDSYEFEDVRIFMRSH